MTERAASAADATRLAVGLARAMVVSVCDVFDALRSNRVYRSGLATDRIKHIMGQQDSTAFNRTLLRRFVNLMGLFPIGTLVRLNTEELAG